MSVLMMSLYVLFGGDAARIPLPGESIQAAHISAPRVTLDTSDFIQLRR